MIPFQSSFLELIIVDGSHNDSRMNVGLALTSALYGATVINHMEVSGLVKDPKTGKITGIKVKDILHEKKGGRLGFGRADQEEFFVEAKVRTLDLQIILSVYSYVISDKCAYRVLLMPLGLLPTASGNSTQVKRLQRL